MNKALPPPPASIPEAQSSEGGSFWDHLAELRQRLKYIAYALVLGFIVAWFFREELFRLATAPIFEALAPYGIYRLMAIHTGEAMMVYVKLCFVADLMVVLPFSIYQLWAFVRPGLLPHEFRPIRRVVVLSLFFFCLGLLFCYHVVLPFLIDFMASFTSASGDVDFQLTMDSAYSTTLNTMLMFGVIFELPLVMVMLTAIPILTWRSYVKFTRYAVVLSFVVGAILTPPDVVSQILMSIPMVGLYGVGILMSWMLERARAKGRPASGPDYGLMLSVLVVVAAMTPFLLPGQWEPRKALPPGMSAAVSISGSTTSTPSCPGQSAGFASVELDLWVCAMYSEGTLLIRRGGGDAVLTCDSEGSQSGLECLQIEGTLVSGPPSLLSAYRARWEMGDAASSPLAQFTGSGTLLFMQPETGLTGSGPHLLAFFPSSQEGRSSLLLSAGSAAEARGLLTQVEAAQGVTAGAAVPQKGQPRLEKALLELTGAVESLATENPEAVAVRASLGEVRRLLSEGPEPSEAQSAACRRVGCLLEPLLPLLADIEDPEVVGKQVRFIVGVPSPERLLELQALPFR